MKKLLLTALVCPAMALAQPSTRCWAEYETARTVMELRQDHYPMPKMVDQANALTNEDDRIVAIVMLYKAYEVPVMQTKSGKKERIDEFANDMYMVCIKRGLK